MICPKCQADNQSDGIFCRRCGTLLPAAEDTAPVTKTYFPASVPVFSVGSTFADRYEIIEEIMQAAHELITTCGCRHGCPSCVGSPIPPFAQLDPDEGGRGMIPDKEAALVMLHYLLGMEAYEPSPPGEEGGPEQQRPQGKPLPVELEGKLRKSLLKKRERK